VVLIKQKILFVGVPLEVFININVNDISSISEVKMVSCTYLCFHL